MKRKKETYSEILKDPRWQKKRLEIMQRDNFTCQHCGCSDKSLQVHHLWYSQNNKPWEYDNDSLITLCERCHELETEYNSELYSTFCELKKIAGEKGFSKQLLASVLDNICFYLENQENDSIKENILALLYNTICGTQLYSDAKALERMGVDMSEFFKNVKYKNLK